jgi:hypothetical protein
MTSYIKLLVKETITDKIAEDFASLVSYYTDASLNENTSGEFYTECSLYQVQEGNVLEIELNGLLSDDVVDKIYENIQLEDFTLLTEAPNNLVVIYPGRFHIFHKGHQAVFKYLSDNMPSADVFIATSGKVEMPGSPFTFEDKLEMMKLTGINENQVVQVSNPYNAEEIISRYDPTTTTVVYAVSKKDMEENPRFKLNNSGPTLKKNGELAYLQKWSGLEDADSVDHHSYIVTTPTFNFKALNKPANSASQMRAMFPTLERDVQKEFIFDIFGKYSQKVHQILISKLRNN